MVRSLDEWTLDSVFETLHAFVGGLGQGIAHDTSRDLSLDRLYGTRRFLSAQPAAEAVHDATPFDP